mmetsp:Transcript_6246/g.18626  ORF Transcript_6246/g.18626 Transcript_6246/m.18626 type:complete len:287 (-) Transcript_6246:67-927(-)
MLRRGLPAWPHWGMRATKSPPCSTDPTTRTNPSPHTFGGRSRAMPSSPPPAPRSGPAFRSLSGGSWSTMRSRFLSRASKSTGTICPPDRSRRAHERAPLRSDRPRPPYGPSPFLQPSSPTGRSPSPPKCTKRPRRARICTLSSRLSRICAGARRTSRQRSLSPDRHTFSSSTARVRLCGGTRARWHLPRSSTARRQAPSIAPRSACARLGSPTSTRSSCRGLRLPRCTITCWSATALARCTRSRRRQPERTSPTSTYGSSPMPALATVTSALSATPLTHRTPAAPT